MLRRKLLFCTILIFSIFIAAAVTCAQNLPEPQSENDPILVGRISYIEGNLLRYVPEDKEWVATVNDAPCGVDDALYSGSRTQAEIIVPNLTSIRVGGDTQIQFITLKDDLTEVDISSGVARFYSNGESAGIKATTPFGYVVAPSESIFDLYVAESSVEVVAIRGKVDFVHASSESSYQVSSESSSILADADKVAAGEPYADTEWDRWNQARDSYWAKLHKSLNSFANLPSELRYDAYALEKYGRWESVYYEGTQHTAWRPTRVRSGWAPFTMGRWTVWHGDQCWIPAEPFGYVTHHYGNWVFVRSSWYWLPPVVTTSVHVHAPAVNVDFRWYPGRVAWISSGIRIGWFPLAPREFYYSHSYWGPRSVVVNRVGITNINTSITQYAYYRRAVIIDSSHMYSVRNYRNSVVRRVNYDILASHYRMSPVVSGSIISNYDTLKHKHMFTSKAISISPSAKFLERIEYNRSMRGHHSSEKYRDIHENVRKLKHGSFAEGANIKPAKARHLKSHQIETGKGTEKIKYMRNEYGSMGKMHGAKFKEKFSYKEKHSYKVKEKYSYKAKDKGIGFHQDRRTKHEGRMQTMTERVKFGGKHESGYGKSGKNAYHKGYVNGKREKIGH